MSLSELIPLVNNLSQSDKLSLFKFLSAQVPDAELQSIFSASEYPVWSPYDATETANILMQMIQNELKASLIPSTVEFPFSNDQALPTIPITLNCSDFSLV
jgi:hypothetical protein